LERKAPSDADEARLKYENSSGGTSRQPWVTSCVKS
jgi:hypothetical protein